LGYCQAYLPLFLLSKTNLLYVLQCPAVYDLAAAGGLRAALTPAADYFSSLGVPEALVHWGHPGNMAVVLFAMGGYGAGYLG
jgi:hypothetical protein